MADDDKLDGIEEAAGKKKKGGLMKMIVIILAGLVLVMVSVGVTLYVTGYFDIDKKKDSAKVLDGLEQTLLDENGVPKQDSAPAKQKKKFPEGGKFEPTYEDFKSNFTINVPNSKKYVQFSLSIMTHYDERVVKNFEKHQIALRSAVISLVSLEPFETYQSTEGLDSLRSRIKDALNRVLRKYEDFGGIEEVYFPQFVIQ